MSNLSEIKKRTKNRQKKLINSFPSLKVSKATLPQLKNHIHTSQKKNILKDEITENLEKDSSYCSSEIPSCYPLLVQKSGQTDIGLSENFIFNDAILKKFDLTYQYGPFKGISRLDRWYRAEKLGLCPPIEIKTILLSNKELGNITCD
ncbi:hypothetical protein PCK1_001457 [Pneumocystis canis]|nr:hypothetical protein PCK1_001457 [Pneumocystis canis]